MKVSKISGLTWVSFGKYGILEWLGWLCHMISRQPSFWQSRCNVWHTFLTTTLPWPTCNSRSPCSWTSYIKGVKKVTKHAINLLQSFDMMILVSHACTLELARIPPPPSPPPPPPFPLSLCNTWPSSCKRSTEWSKSPPVDTGMHSHHEKIWPFLKFNFSS